MASMMIQKEQNSIFQVNVQSRNRKEGTEEEKQLKNGSIFANKLNLKDDMISMKREQARKQAYKVIMDYRAVDQKMDQTIIDNKDKIAALKEESKELLSEIDDIESQKEKLKEKMGITEESQEEKDLELLRKASKEPFNLSKEESARLKEMGPKTEYQERMLEYDETQGYYKSLLSDNKEKILQADGEIKGIKSARLKSRGMIDSKKEADDILKASSKEIIGMLMDESKDHVDKEIEEEKEKAQEAKEKKEEEEAKTGTEDSAAKKETSQLENIQQGSSEQNKFEMEVKKLLEKQKLLEEDLKGVGVDKQV